MTTASIAPLGLRELPITDPVWRPAHPTPGEQGRIAPQGRDRHRPRRDTMSKAIVTTYRGPTDTKGSRITASDGDGNRVTIPYPHELSGEFVHRKAAEALRDKMGWTGPLVGGATKTGYAFVFIE